MIDELYFLAFKSRYHSMNLRFHGLSHPQGKPCWGSFMIPCFASHEWRVMECLHTTQPSMNYVFG